MAIQVSGREEKFLREAQAPYLVDTERAMLARFLARLEEECGNSIQRVILYGSKARGDANEESDTDLLIVATDAMALTKVEQIAHSFESQDSPHTRPSWRLLTKDDYAEYRRLMFPFYVNVRRDGVELWNPATSLIEEIEFPLEFPEGEPRAMTPETIETIRRYVEETREEWHAAEKLCDEMPLFAIPHAYYAIFYIATAALYAVNVVRGKHAGVRDGLSEFLVKPKLLEAEYKDIYDRVMNGRVLVNYRPFQDAAKIPTDDDARQLLVDAARFIARMETFLRERGAIE